jgi:hypothetical protein
MTPLCVLCLLCGQSMTRVTARAQSVEPLDGRAVPAVAVIQAYADDLAGRCTARPGVRLSVGRASAIGDDRVLTVDYPAPADDPAARDVQCTAENQNWTSGRAIAFQARPEQSLRMSMSFIDKNGVVYTAWADLKGGVWQRVRIAFDEIRPNPYFQPPNARRGAPIDVSDVKFIAFAPQDRTSGRLAIGRIVVSN